MRETLPIVVIGGGPKAVATAVKLAVLKDLGFATPELIVIERQAIAQHWRKMGGWTDGLGELGTPPEKDVGFPYRSILGSKSMQREINQRMLAYSWPAFLIEQDRYASWIDQGRPAPSHEAWAGYLTWAFTKAGNAVRLVTGTVTSLAIRDDRWLVKYTSDHEETAVTAQAVMLTGPGRPLGCELETISDAIYGTARFWANLARVTAAPPRRLAVIGAGESAAQVLTALVGVLPLDARIDVVSPQGIAYSRGESYFENRLYSDPEGHGWASLAAAERREFIRRTDRGVFSPEAQRRIARHPGVRMIAGTLGDLQAKDSGLHARFFYQDTTWMARYEMIVLAMGADPLASLDELLSDEAKRHVLARLDAPALTREVLEPRIGRDLAIGGLAPKLILPAIAGFAQGPGFQNLSSLGALSDRVLEPFVMARAQTGATTRPRLIDVRVKQERVCL